MNLIRRRSAGRRITPDPPDTSYALILGTYAAMLLAPGIGGVVVDVVDGDAVIAAAMLVAVPGTIVVVTWLVTRARGLPERLGAAPLAYSFQVLAACALAGYLVVGVTDLVPGTMAFVGMFSAGAGIFVGGFLAQMSRTRRAKTLVEATTVDAGWTAGWPERRTRRVRRVGFGLVVLGAPMVLGRFVTSLDWLFVPGYVLLIAGFVLAGLGPDRTYRVTQAGLERSGSIHQVLYGWDQFSGYRDAGDALVIERSAPWRPPFRCDWTQLDDPAAVRVALSQYLDRLD